MPLAYALGALISSGQNAKLLPNLGSRRLGLAPHFASGGSVSVYLWEVAGAFP